MATKSSAAVVSSPKSILDLSFNQDGGCFTVATDEGFIVFRADPFIKISCRIFSSSDGGGGGGGIGIVQMLYPSNIFALVGGGPTPKFSPNRVMIWDDRLDRCIGELSFRSNVKNLRLTHDRIVVVLLQKILVYNLFDMKLLHETVTEHNPKGLCEVSRTGPLVLLCLGLHKGQVRIEHYARRRSQHIQAHDSDIACFSLMDDGKLVATASSKGTLIRVFNSLDGSLLQELRRGFERAEIYSLSFCSTAPWLAASSDKGTIHVFNLNINDSKSLRINGWEKTEPKKTAPSPVSRLSFIKGVLPKYCSSEWSMAQFRVKEGLQHKVSFGQQKNTLNIIGIDGRFYRCQFDPEAGGEMTKLECHNFIQTELN